MPSVAFDDIFGVSLLFLPAAVRLSLLGLSCAGQTLESRLSNRGRCLQKLRNSVDRLGDSREGLPARSVEFATAATAPSQVCPELSGVVV
jgi:hypothetical protein